MLSWIGFITFLILLSCGVLWSFLRGANAFSVFYAAWKLVLTSHPQDIYWNTPDRFLYAPGFAWLLAPLALFPKAVALGIWNALKVGAVVYLTVIFRKKTAPRVAFGTYALGVVLLARPLLIDFQYGQVNLLVLVSCVFALFTFFEAAPTRRKMSISWFLLGVMATAKLLAMPLLLLPWLSHRKEAWTARMASLSGVVFLILLPLVSAGGSGTWELLRQWKAALASKGLPLETHNQSFISVIHHLFTGIPTHVIALYRQVQIGWPLLSPQTVLTLGTVWAVFFLALLCVLMFWLSRRRTPVDTASAVALLAGLIIVPSHLVWKPYFVMGIPLALRLIPVAISRPLLWGLLAILGAAINLTSFDIAGHSVATLAEAGGILFFAHLALLASVAWLTPPNAYGQRQ